MDTAPQRNGQTGPTALTARVSSQNGPSRQRTKASSQYSRSPASNPAASSTGIMDSTRYASRVT